MPPSTDQPANPTLTSHIACKNKATATLPHKIQRRSSSWSQYHSKQPSNPFFLSRCAREQGGLIRDKRRDKSGDSDETLNSSKLRHNLDLTSRLSTLRIVGISEESAPGAFLGHKTRGLYHLKKTNQAQAKVLGKDGIESSIDPGVGKSPAPSPHKKPSSCIDEKPLLQLNTALPALPADPICNLANLLGHHLNQNNSTKEGAGRRKAMRTVSQDDYLLARGANPRTGVVTPSVHSGSSSIDDQEFLRITEMTPHAKWRLKGDQWISLSLDEPSPLPSPPSERNIRRRGRPLRTPPKLAHGRQPQYGTDVQDFERHKIDDMAAYPNTKTQGNQTGQRSEIALPLSGGKPTRAQATEHLIRLVPGNHDRSGELSMIRRKPLGTPPRKHSTENVLRSNDLPEASTETVITKSGPAEQFRSSSMPTPRKIRFFKPEDVGKALPALPLPKANEYGVVKEESRSQAMPFLGLRPAGWIGHISSQANVNHYAPEKKLPCPPTNDTRFQFHRSERTNMRVSPTTIPMHTNQFGNQQRRINFLPHTEGKRSAVLRSRPRIPPRQYQVAQSTSMNNQIVMSTGAEAMNYAHTSPSTITPTTTLTTTVQTPPEDRLVSSSWREMPSPLHLGRRRADMASRPAMPERAEGTNSVPQVSPQKELQQQYQWGMTGTSDSEISASSTPMEGSPERALIPSPLRPSNGNTTGFGRRREVAAGNVTDADQPTKNCLRCQGSSLDARQHNMHGFTHTQGNQLLENVEPLGNLGFASGFSPNTPEDHSGCCPECCAVGCHGSCLGHKSPPESGSTSGFTGSLGAMRGSMRNSMRLSRRIRIRTSAGGSRETETEELAELETPMSWETAGPVSLGLPSKITPQNFWGGSHRQNDNQRMRAVSSVSASTVNTYETPNVAGLGALFEALIVPFGALSMWLKKHPQLLDLMQVVVMKLLEMSKHVLDTAGKAYRVAYIYSKTGRISPEKHSSLSGLVRDCVTAVVYGLILAAVAMLVGRVLAVFAGAGSWLIWSLSWFVWLVKAVGLGILW